MRSHLLVYLPFAAVLATVEVGSTQPTVIRGDPTCRTCRVERQVIARFGEGDDEIINGPVVSAIARDSKGRYFVIDQDKGPVKMFAPTGKFLTLLGREGAGPGETRSAATVTVSARDSIFVTDRVLMRCNVFGPDLKFVRAFPLSVAAIRMHSQVVGSQLVLNARSGDAAGIGFPLFVFGETGQRVKLIGPEETQVDDANLFRMDRVITRAQLGRAELLVADIHRYRWSRLSAQLEPGEEFVREASWFRGFERPTARPAPLTWTNGVSEVKTLWEDSAGRIWVALGTYHITAADSALAVSGVFTGWRQTTRVEVLDLRNKTVLAADTFDQKVVSGFSDGTVMTAEVLDDGRTVLSLVRLALRR